MPDELIALFDGQGQSVGSKSRAAAYSDGDRVGLVFVWAAWRTSSSVARTLLQTRSRPGDPYLGSLDAPAGGHIRAGETPAAAAQREFVEEVGIALKPAELVFLGQQPLQHTGRSAMQFFYLCTRPISLGETIFNEEVGAFAEVALDDFDTLVCGRTASIQGQAHYREAPNETRPREITPAAFAAYSEPIMDAIRRSVGSIRTYLDTGQIDATIWPPATG
ncbi:MAG: NUDIX domain-containing protein [Gemmatimonadetes bacterium]|nr:NUDIX domain-containing protein [Gemmatimonadota bacterium]